MSHHTFDEKSSAIAAVEPQLDGTAPWVVVGLLPERSPGAVPAAVEPSIFQRWVHAEAAVWPAPIPLGAHRPELRADRLVVRGGGLEGARATGFYGEFGADGSGILALQAGSVQRSPVDGADVWALGEGAVVWMTVAALRLLARHALRTGASTEGSARLGVVVDGQAHPVELWNRRAGRHGPVTETRVTEVTAVEARIGLGECGSPRLALAVRPVLIDFLAQFGVPDLRHIDRDGAIWPATFTGHDQAVADWAGAMGVRCRTSC